MTAIHARSASGLSLLAGLYAGAAGLIVLAGLVLGVVLGCLEECAPEREDDPLFVRAVNKTIPAHFVSVRPLTSPQGAQILACSTLDCAPAEEPPLFVRARVDAVAEVGR